MSFSLLQSRPFYTYVPHLSFKHSIKHSRPSIFGLALVPQPRAKGCRAVKIGNRPFNFTNRKAYVEEILLAVNARNAFAFAPLSMAVMHLIPILTLLACVPLLLAQTQNDTCCDVDVSSIPQATRQAWCTQELQSCKTICGGSNTPENTCQSVSMSIGRRNLQLGRFANSNRTISHTHASATQPSHPT